MSETSPQFEERSPFDSFGGRRPTAFVDAGRHTARVQFLRRAIIAVCVGAVGLIGFIVVFDPLHRLQIGFSIASVGLEGTRITMDKPRLSGFRADGLPYEVKANSVVQDTRRPKVFELDQVDAKLGGKGGSTTFIQAAKGLYDSETDKLDLSGAVRVRSPGQFDMKLSQADVDMRASRVESRQPVVVDLPNGRINAAGAIFEDATRKLEFIGPVQSQFHDDTTDAPTPDAQVMDEPTRNAPKSNAVAGDAETKQ
ncbi:MAG: LPS export ABC transporter periplasmic protein LptC [Rhodoblastus sp.]